MCMDKKKGQKCGELWLTIHQRIQITYRQRARQNGTKLTRSTETFNDLTNTCSSNTAPRRKPTTIQNLHPAWKAQVRKGPRGEGKRNEKEHELRPTATKECRKLLDDDEASKAIVVLYVTVLLQLNAMVQSTHYRHYQEFITPKSVQWA